jgi:hypothetical protein
MKVKRSRGEGQRRADRIRLRGGGGAEEGRRQERGGGFERRKSEV